MTDRIPQQTRFTAPDPDDDRAQRMAAILARADRRDQAAEKRDRDSAQRSAIGVRRDTSVDRYWAGRDRDSAAVDRSDLIDLLHGHETEHDDVPEDEPVTHLEVVRHLPLSPAGGRRGDD
jgi:hypothetical protein